MPRWLTHAGDSRIAAGLIQVGIDDFGKTYCADPDPNTGWIQRPITFWFQNLPSFFAWKKPLTP
jgi:hypothetical protein